MVVASDEAAMREVDVVLTVAQVMDLYSRRIKPQDVLAGVKVTVPITAVLNGGVAAPESRRRWTDRDDWELRRRVEEGESDREIGVAMGRSASAVACRRSKIGP
jgi:hypothetical protein